LSDDDIDKINEEVKQLKQQVVSIGNTTYSGRYIFSGFSTSEKFLNDDGSFATKVSNEESIIYEIGIGETINVNVFGGDVFNKSAGEVAADGNADAGQTGSFITHLDELIESMDNSNSTSISNMLEKLDKDIDNLLRVRSDIGARQNRLELTLNRVQNDVVNFTKLLSENEDVDMAKTIMEMQNEENVYKASLSAGAKIIMPSLMDFLS
jgi:flagellar hook-associated protein 3 FlgL